MERGKWNVECGMWNVESGKRKVESCYSDCIQSVESCEAVCFKPDAGLGCLLRFTFIYSWRRTAALILNLNSNFRSSGYQPSTCCQCDMFICPRLRMQCTDLGTPVLWRLRSVYCEGTQMTTLRCRRQRQGQNSHIVIVSVARQVIVR